MTLMNKEIRDILLTSTPPHKGFGFRPVEYDDTMVLRISLETLANYPERQRQDLVLWIFSLASKVFEMGCPCSVEGVERDDQL